MKIITEGKIPKPKLPAWVGLKMTCRICNTLFELEEDDYPDIISVTSVGIFYINNNRKIRVHCPMCKAVVSAKYEI